MNSFELNKIFGAILGTLVFVMGVGFIAEEIYHPIQNRGATYLLPEPEAGGAAGPAEVAQVEPIEVRMLAASAEAGERLMNRCQSCHDYSPANANRTGPGIYDIVGQEIAYHEGFAYSDALAALGAAGEIWDYQHLDDFLASPRGYAPGTKMTFAGLSNPIDRANLIAYLRTLSTDPYPLPDVSAEVVVEDEAIAEEEVTGFDDAPVVDVDGPVEQSPSAVEEHDQPGN
ncbi:c-type cytochrome [Pelagibacterium limicola]|uniref:c-type cytochrome n=1 Tax=Pelagibacterium limicola TaxID=2791022 RepID=UPI0018AF60B0|nr:cytochrome c family protein [Pelagibacterium limicola]